MKRRPWDANTTTGLVMEDLQGKPVAELCNTYQMSQSQSYQWRDQFLAHASRAFEVHQYTQQEARLVQANARFKTLVGELTLQFKTSGAVLGCVGSPRPWAPSATKRSLSASGRSRPSPRAGAIVASGPIWALWSSSRFTRSGAGG
jgi:transposase-like protein